MEEIGLPELSSEQKENLCIFAENAARKYIASKAPLRKIPTLDIAIEVEGEKPVTVNVEIELSLAISINHQDIQQITNEAAQKAQQAAEAYLKEIACKSTE